MFQFVWLAPYAHARRFRHETWAASIDVPVIVHEVMKAGFRYSPAEIVAVFVQASLKATARLNGRPVAWLIPVAMTRACSSDWGTPTPPFMRMRREEINQTGRRGGIAHQLVNRFDNSNLLIIAITTRMVIRPGDCGRVLIVTCVLRLIGVQVGRVEEMRGADAANRCRWMNRDPDGRALQVFHRRVAETE